MAADSRQQPDHGRGRRIALGATATLTMLAIALVVWSAASGRSGAGSTSTPTAPTPTPTLQPGAPQATPSGEAPVPPPHDVQDLISQSKQGRLEFVNDRGEVIRELLYKRLEPREGGRVEVFQPQAWIHLASGAIAHLEANRGSLLQPQGQREPESGRFEGDVRIRVYETDPRLKTGDASPDDPTLIFTTESLNFDTTMGEVRGAEPVRIEARGVDVRFTGFSLIFDEVRQRLALFETNSPGRAVIDLDALKASRQDKNERPGDQAGAPGADSAAIAENLYHSVVTGDVRIEANGRRAAADQLDLWARLLGDRFTPRTIEALGALTASTSTSTPGADDSVGRASRPSMRKAKAPNEPITLTWSTSMTISPLDETPAELRDDDALARLNSPAGGVVTLTDDDSKISTQSVSLDYAVASQRLIWTGLGPRGVILRQPGSFETISGRMELDMPAGLATFPGPGLIRSFPTGDADPDRPITPRLITWRQRGELVLKRTDRGIDFSAKPLIQRALFSGDAEASDAQSSITGEQMQAFFALNSAGATTISRAIVTGSARADAGDSGLLTANRIDVEFDLSDPIGPTPAVATAQGDVRAEQAGSTLRADLAEARFRRDADDTLTVDSFSADLGVVVKTRDGVEATADSLRASPNLKVVDLTGESTRLAANGAVITGSRIRIDQGSRTLAVIGAGTLEREAGDAALGYDTMRLTWRDSMNYDDLAGSALFKGHCELTADRPDLGRDVVRAASIQLQTLAYADRAADTASGALPILKAIAHGDQTDSTDPAPAEIEARRYTPDSTTQTGLRLTRLLYLSGQTIIADVRRDELRVPQPGRLLIESRPIASGSAGAPASTDALGTTMIEWDGAFLLRRSAGSADFRRRVRVRRRPLGASKVIELECERLELAFDAKPAPENSITTLGDFLWAQAQGAVYAAQGTRQVIADRLLYDHALGFAELTAAPDNIVTLFDARSPTPLTGELLRWDLLRDRIEWRGARAAAAPD